MVPSRASDAASFRVVISAEANAYMAWQAKLAHYSCLSRLGQPAIVVVHQGSERGLRDFADIRRTGGLTVSAPSYRLTSRGRNYAPRNTAGTLLEAAHAVSPRIDYLILCDPDVVFRRALDAAPVLTGAACGYMDYAELPVRAAMKRLGIDPRRVGPEDDGPLCCGIPYIIPRALAEPLALAWLDAIDAFLRPRWEDVMHAFGLAVLMLRLRLRRLSIADTNFDGGAPARAPVVHYCYDNPLWSKRRFVSGPSARQVWRPPNGAPPGSVLAEIFKQLEEAGRFYSACRVTPRRARSDAPTFPG
jgi:hypothetical protein